MVFQESETVELKSVVVEDIKKEIIAFANCEGGKLYIGVQTMVRLWDLMIQMALHCRSAIWFEMRLSLM